MAGEGTDFLVDAVSARVWQGSDNAKGVFQTRLSGERLTTPERQPEAGSRYSASSNLTPSREARIRKLNRRRVAQRDKKPPAARETRAQTAAAFDQCCWPHSPQKRRQPTGAGRFAFGDNRQVSFFEFLPGGRGWCVPRLAPRVENLGLGYPPEVVRSGRRELCRHVEAQLPHAMVPRAMLTAWMISETVTPDGQTTSVGMPCWHMEQSVLVPRAKLTNRMISPTSTISLPSQSPTQVNDVALAVGVGVADGVAVRDEVAVDVAAWVGVVVGVGVDVAVSVGLNVRV
jgi:hypothetical protein